MITEDYVNFETAKLLKDKGFPQEYDDYHALVYNEEDYEDEYEVQRFVLEIKLVKAGTLSSYPIGVPEPKCYCCTLQMAMKWLREVHNIHITIYYSAFLYGTHPYYWSIDKMDSIPRANTQIKTSTSTHDYSFAHYEKACESAIRYCLEHLI